MASNYNEKWFEQLKSVDVGNDGKNDLKDIKLREIAKEILNSEDVRKRPPELFNKLVEDIIELLRQKDIDENKLRQTLKDKQIELFKDIKAKSVKNADERGIMGRLGNLYSEYEAKTFIEEQEKKNNFYILDYDSKNGNHVKKVSDFEIELRHNNLASINTTGLANYLIYLSKYQLLESFFAKLSENNKDLLISIIYLESNNKYDGKFTFISKLKEQNQSGIVNKIIALSKFEISNKKLTKNTVNYIVETFSGKVDSTKKEQFKEDVNKSEGVYQILECLNKYNTNPTPADITNIFREVHKNYDQAVERHTEKQREIVINARHGKGLSENSALEDLIATNKIGAININLRKKPIKDLTEKDWELLDKLSIGSLVSDTVGKLLVQTREKNKIQTNSKSASIIAFDERTNAIACALAACKTPFSSNVGLLENQVNNNIVIYDRANEFSEIFLTIIRSCPGFENTESLKVIQNTSVAAFLYNHIKQKKDKSGDEIQLQKILKDKIGVDKKGLAAVTYLDKKDKNYYLESKIQDEFLSVIQNIPGYEGINNVGDIMYDKFALDWAINYLNKIKNKTKQQKEVLDKLKQFRTNLGDINKLEKTVLKNDIQLISAEYKNTSNIISQQYIANNSNFDLNYILSGDTDSRKIFFDTLFSYIDSNGDAVKYLTTPVGTKFAISKDGDNTYKIKYGDREIKSLTREQTRESVSFAMFLEPLGLSELIPYSTRIINEINKKSNGEPINDRDGMNEKEKYLCLSKLGQAIIPGFEKKPEIEENKKQFTNFDIINNNLKAEKKTQDYGRITSLSQLLKLQFPTSSKDSFDIKALLEAIPS